MIAKSDINNVHWKISGWKIDEPEDFNYVN